MKAFVNPKFGNDAAGVFDDPARPFASLDGVRAAFLLLPEPRPPVRCVLSYRKPAPVVEVPAAEPAAVETGDA